MSLWIREEDLAVFRIEPLRSGYFLKPIPIPYDIVDEILCSEDLDPFPPLIYWAHQFEIDEPSDSTSSKNIE